ncbi:Ubiquitin carboxyl-terminal hydrolase 14 [Geodia barretti]|uniref:Ubiquitin carboxyl-terminal hydrolase 14 n=1 Tax=Geodia barretti TaxID=519541 RepID=A0AA35TJY3_GEOBA|nr:Ubiquitin carboxyl-terminal hydrolase 14 [Geodia barretti]
MKLDMYEFCTTELQQKLSPMRTKFKEQEEKKMAQKAKLIAEGKLLGPKLAGAAAIAKKDENVEYEPFQFEDGAYEMAGEEEERGWFVHAQRKKDDVFLAKTMFISSVKCSLMYSCFM